ncbi:hypothetical protein [Thermomonospora cellulosilytica]|uniref:Uncharacterized protein n=1 Tax=Thermomonospora cellulosilytica TaxID=1411118 RepID=A0A7W3MYE8_9ACTN|nr:hypothetical protein [Thermomonospora cellulosilytica]MBA9004151.1 hypothetical protein [Thermomonospora cellulosilytica]
MTGEGVIGKITAEFLSVQPDDWLVRFYGFLQQNQALWRAPRWRGDPPGPARMKPIIRLEDGSHVRPFDAADKPNAYLPGSTGTRFPTVRRSIAAAPEAKQFLEALGLTEPDVVAEVMEYVIPRYHDTTPDQLDPEQHTEDLNLISKALSKASGRRREQLTITLQRTPFVISRNAATNRTGLRTPADTYMGTPELQLFFEGNPDAWLADDLYRPWLPVLQELGLQDRVRVTAKKPDWRNHVILIHGWGLHERGLNGFDPHAQIDGLEYALRHPTLTRSAYVWNNLLIPNSHLIAGIIEKSSRKDFSDPELKAATSQIGAIAKRERWLPNAHGGFRSPSELRLDDLPQSFTRDHVLAKALGMIQPVLEEASRELGIPAEILRALKDHPDLLEKLDQEIRARAQADRNDHGEDPKPSADDVDFAKELSVVFDRPGRPPGHEGGEVPSTGSGQVGNPAFRRERIKEGIAADREAEPPAHERFRRVPRRTWEAKDGAVKHFLLEQYGGRCQICDDVFPKYDGTPYFEGLYLVSRLRGRWLNRPGNVLCLCATCCAKFQYGAIDGQDVTEQIRKWRTAREGGGPAVISLTLCGEAVQLRFTEKHLLELQEIINSAPGSADGDTTDA